MDSFIYSAHKMIGSQLTTNKFLTSHAAASINNSNNSEIHKEEKLEERRIEAKEFSSSLNINLNIFSKSNIDNNINRNNSNNVNNNTINQFIDPTELKNKLENFGTRILVIFLDCRPFPDFNSKHIKDSVHLNCRDKIIKKRLQTNKLSVRDLISSDEIKEKFDYNGACIDSPTVSINQTTNNLVSNNDSSPSDVLENEIREKLIVVYDETCEDLQSDSNPLKIVQENIKKSGKKECKILKGGFRSFFENFPDLCVNKTNDLKSLKKNKYYFDNQLDQQQSEIENAIMTKIFDYLYLGNELDAKNVDKLDKEGIHYVLNVTKNIPFYDDHLPQSSRSKFKFKRIAVNDCSNQNLKVHYEEAIAFIEEARQNNSKVLVHCQAGISRSPTIVIAFLMSKIHLKMNDAYNFVREKRPIIAPNLVFMSQLMDYETKLNNTKSDVNKVSSNSSTGYVSCHSEPNIYMDIDPVRVN